jgi:glycosyltransferase involved in cell wall biosynthesis
MVENYIPKDERKKILLLSDDFRFFSGVATMSRELIKNTAQHFNWAQLAGAQKHPEPGKQIDLSEAINKEIGILDSSVTLYTTNGYGTIEVIRDLIKREKPDAIMLFTDPRYWIWLFNHEREIRSQIPIIYLNIWDNLPYPMYNKPYYESCDILLAISKQTENINRVVLGEDAFDKTIKYFPHGIDKNMFFPIEEGSIEYESLKELKKKLMGSINYDYTLFFNSRNIGRKNVTNLLMGWKRFIENFPENKKALILHTHIVDNGGTDLKAVIEMIFTTEEQKHIFFTGDNLPPEHMNLIYNASDCVILPSSQEGWGLSITEGLMCGKPIIATVTGGLQDQMRFEDENGGWIEFDEEFGTNHRGQSEKCGEWAFPLFPDDISLIGSPPTPYIFDDRVTPESIASSIMHTYQLGSKELKRRGMLGRDWVTSEESGMSSQSMGKKFIDIIKPALENFEPQPNFEFINTNSTKINSHYNKNIINK